MKLSQKTVRDTAVVEISGKMIGGPDATKLQTIIRSIIDGGGKTVVVNLHRTSWANSLGIGMLIGAYTSMRNAGGNLALAHVADRINDILAITQLALIFKEFDTVDEAIDYLIENPEGDTNLRTRGVAGG